MIVQFGGQTPLNLALPLKAAGVNIIGTSPESIDLAEDRKRFGKLLDELEIPQAPGAMAASAWKKRSKARSESDTRCWCALRTCWADAPWSSPTTKTRSCDYMKEAVEYSQDRPVLIDHFLEDAIEVDVDALSDGEDVVIGGIMQHIEEAGIHSGDSSCVLPAVRLWGVNLNFNGVFPPKDQAVGVAARLAKFGFNAVRIHHFDGNAAPNGIWKPLVIGGSRVKIPRVFDEEQLDRFNFFMSELIRRGIYLDLNMHVGRKKYSRKKVFLRPPRCPIKTKV